jgi:hypothetical protein
MPGPRGEQGRLDQLPSALFFNHSKIIVWAAGSEAARAALAAGDFGTVYQRVAVFDLLGMVAAAVCTRGLSAVELRVH